MKPLLGLKLVLELEEKLKQVSAAVSAQVAMLEDMKVAKLMRMQLILVAVRQGVAAKQMSMLVLELEEKLRQVRAAVPAQVAMLEDTKVAKLMRMQLILVAVRQWVAAKQMSMPALEVVALTINYNYGALKNQVVILILFAVRMRRIIQIIVIDDLFCSMP
jgi:hypothetical protein